MATTLGIVVRSDSWLRRYKYTWAAVGVGLLLLTFVFGTEINGQRLTLQIGPFSGQPTELLKVILVVFLAGYLSENRALLVEQDTRLGPLRLPPLPYLAPMVAMWAIALGIVVIQRDLGAALLFFGVFLAMLYVATGRISLVIIGLVLFLLGSALMADPVRPHPDPGRHLARSVRRPARGRLPGRPGAPRVRARRAARGRARRAACPRSAGDRRSPRSTRTSRWRRSARSSAIVGVVAILGLYLVVVERGLRIGAAAADDFRSLLAIGLALVIGIQAFIIAAGNLKVLPLTGVTLPFISYGGSSLLANALVVGLLLALSDKGVEPPPLPRVGSRWRRIAPPGGAADARRRARRAGRSAGRRSTSRSCSRSRSRCSPGPPATGASSRRPTSSARRTTRPSSRPRGPCRAG